MIMPDEPTYWTEVDGEDTIYHCGYCADQQMEHHATDAELFLLHMQQRHDGRMLEGDAPPEALAAAAQRAQPAHPHGGPPGQTGDHPEHPYGGPPGQTGESPEEPEPEEPPEPTHPMVPPDEEPPKPEQGA